MEEKVIKEPTLIDPSEVTVDELTKQLHESKTNYYEDFDKDGTLHLLDYSGVHKFKSIRRAIRRGHCSIYGEVYPHRPFKNHSPKNNPINRVQRGYYQQLKHRNTIY